MKNAPAILQADPTDAEDIDLSTDALDRGQRARLIRLMLMVLGLSQTDLALRFHITVGAL